MQLPSLYFTPIFPDQTGDTVKSSILGDHIKWIPLISMKTIESNLEETTESEKNKSFSKLSFQSDICQQKGKKAEELFLLKVSTETCWKHKKIKNSDEYDYKHHVDVMVKLSESSNEEYWFDVKCMRSLRRGWSEQSEYMWVELNTTGWLFGGKATHIAQQIGLNTFAIFDKIKLQEYVKLCVNVNEPIVPYPEQSYHRVYLRKSLYKTSVLSLIKTEDAFKFAGCKIL